MFKVRLHSIRAEGDNPSPHLAAMLGLEHPRVWLALWVARAHC